MWAELGQAVGGLASSLWKGGANKSGKKHQFDNLVASAKNAGIHPLFALGSGGVPGPQWSASDTGSAISNAASAVGSALDESARARREAKGESERKAVEKQLFDAQLRQMSASAARDEAAAAYSLSEKALLDQKLNANGTGRGITVESDFNEYPGREALSRAVDSIYGPPVEAMIRVRTPDGKVILVPNPDAGGGSMIRPFLQELRELTSGQGAPQFKSQFGSGMGH